MVKNRLTKIIILIFIFFFTIGNSFVFATTEINYEEFKPTVEGGTRVVNVVSSLLGVLTTLGAIATAISIALIGFNSILGSASEKAEYQQKLVGVVIAAIIITCGSMFAKFIISVAEGI